MSECGGKHRKDNKAHHVNTDKHIKFIYDKEYNFNFIDLTACGWLVIGAGICNPRFITLKEKEKKADSVGKVKL